MPASTAFQAGHGYELTNIVEVARICFRRDTHCVHRIAMHPSRPQTLFIKKHWDVMLSDDSGDSWQKIIGAIAGG